MFQSRQEVCQGPAGPCGRGRHSQGQTGEEGGQRQHLLWSRLTFLCQDTRRRSREKEAGRDGHLGSLPADLKAWADRRASSPSPARRKARRSRSREKVAAPRDRTRSRERRRRSRSRDGQRKKRSRSTERNKSGEKSVRDSRSNQIKRRRNHRLASDKDRSLNSDSEWKFYHFINNHSLLLL